LGALQGRLAGEREHALYTTVELYEEHGITAALHESALASIIKSKLNVEMTKEVTEEMCKQITPSGFLIVHL
jgi:hypothetical protein